MLARVVGGLGILNPSQDPTLDCSLEAFGVFKPACWVQVLNQGAFPAPPAIAPPLAPTGGVLWRAPASGAEAQQTVADVSGASVAAGQQQQQQFFQTVGTSGGLLDTLAAAANDPAASLLMWGLGIGAALLFLSAVVSK